ncbi:A24 family peptidase [Arsenicicoccus piscis]|uniref:Prepilin type IV endopeptidase peptidase domain-containing protein n=1 Tax=Arsenicicoccus piscis TaxID=673954 RepID=A0ABQ6HPS0_9MICO|nr:A24 family peptidase [Arsenicicoccus piscis]MCH8628150.1 A24 family peptidase [Arsenicicoccus piscis]GMA20469.1 hypothetical protein GCM10025862_24900 [Arsenicicoccus piscis]
MDRVLAPSLLVALLALPAGVGVRRWLDALGYRRADEVGRVRRPTGWVVPVTVLAAVVMWAAVTPAHGPGLGTVYTLAVPVAVALAGVDLDVHRLPDAIQLPAYPMLLAALAAECLVSGQWAALGRAVLVGTVALAAFLTLALVAPGGGVGLGDVKLAGLLGIALGRLGWTEAGVGFYLAFVVGGLVAAVLLLRRRAGRSTRLAFGPALLAGALAGVVLS